ncbi:AsmA family protein, partial [Candidatus Zixiibacteriota bacterium]
MKRLLRLLAILAGTLVAALVLALIFARLYFTDEKILATVRPQLEEKLTREIEIQSAELSFWGGLGVRLEQVTLGNAPGFNRPVFLHLDELDVKVKFWPLFSGDVVFDRVLLGPGELRLEADSLGNNWTDIVKPDTTKPVTPTDSLVAALPKIPLVGQMEFSDITVSFDDYCDGSSLELGRIDGWLEMIPQVEEIGARARGEFQIDSGSYTSPAITLDLAQAQPRFDFDLRVSLPKKSIGIDKSTLTIFGIPIRFSGTVENFTDTARYAIDVKIESTPLASVFEVLPDSLWLPSFPDG